MTKTACVSDFRTASKNVWRVEDDNTTVAGYWRNIGNFHQVIVRNAGHILPYDQPKAALDMMTRFINETAKTDDDVNKLCPTHKTNSASSLSAILSVVVLVTGATWLI